MGEEIYFQDNKGSILSLDKIAFRNCADIVVDKKYDYLGYNGEKVLFTVEDKNDITVYGTLWEKKDLGRGVSKGKIMPITMRYDHEDIAKQVFLSDKDLLEGKVLIKLSHGVAVFECDINFDNLLRKLHIKGGN